MQDILNMPLRSLADISFDCDCGHTHDAHLGTILIEDGASFRVAELAAPYLTGTVMLVADTHTYAVLGKRDHAQLEAAADPVKTQIFTEHHLIPDARTLGTLLIEASAEPVALLVAVGSGTLNDVTRFISARLHIPYIIVGTAPSMDGYAGNSSPIVCRNNKETFLTTYPTAVIADTAVMAEAPSIMICAGFGDILGKYVALADWQLARDVKGEYYCPLISQLMANAVQQCVDNLPGIAGRDLEAMRGLVEALCLAGITMGLANVTRPASGSEHHLTHYIDVDSIKRGVDYPLHGNSVGVFTVVMTRFYEMARADGHIKIESPPSMLMVEYLKQLGAPAHPRELGVDRALFTRALLEAKDLRPRYSILSFAHENGFLQEYVQKLTDEFYGR